MSGAKGLKYLISALVEDGLDLDSALRLCTIGASGELDDADNSQWQDIPRPLRSWIQQQDGLKIHGHPISSINDLVHGYQLMCRTPKNLKCVSNVGATSIVLEVAIRYYKQIQEIGCGESSIRDLVIYGKPPRDIMPRKCNKCQSILLDDQFARYKKLNPTRYVARFLRDGCGSPKCTGGTGCWAIPYDDKERWVPPDHNPLERSPRDAPWTEYLLRNDGRDKCLPTTVMLVCRKCQDVGSSDEDKEPRWTIEEPARYVVKKPRCKTCNSKSVTWAPQDTSVEWIDPAALSKAWKTFVEQGWNISDLSANPNIYFPRKRAP